MEPEIEKRKKKRLRKAVIGIVTGIAISRSSAHLQGQNINQETNKPPVINQETNKPPVGRIGSNPWITFNPLMDKPYEMDFSGTKITLLSCGNPGGDNVIKEFYNLVPAEERKIDLKDTAGRDKASILIRLILEVGKKEIAYLHKSNDLGSTIYTFTRSKILKEGITKEEGNRVRGEQQKLEAKAYVMNHIVQDARWTFKKSQKTDKEEELFNKVVKEYGVECMEASGHVLTIVTDPKRIKEETEFQRREQLKNDQLYPQK